MYGVKVPPRMSGSELSGCVTLVAAAFADGADQMRQLSQKRRKSSLLGGKDTTGDLPVYEVLAQSSRAVKRAYEDGIQEMGSSFRIGDDAARTRLLSIAIVLDNDVVQPLRQASTARGKTDLDLKKILEFAVSARYDALHTLDELKEHLELMQPMSMSRFSIDSDEGSIPSESRGSSLSTPPRSSVSMTRAKSTTSSISSNDSTHDSEVPATPPLKSMSRMNFTTTTVSSGRSEVPAPPPLNIRTNSNVSSTKSSPTSQTPTSPKTQAPTTPTQAPPSPSIRSPSIAPSMKRRPSSIRSPTSVLNTIFAPLHRVPSNTLPSSASVYSVSTPPRPSLQRLESLQHPDMPNFENRSKTKRMKPVRSPTSASSRRVSAPMPTGRPASIMSIPSRRLSRAELPWVAPSDFSAQMSIHPAFRTPIEPVAELEGSAAPAELSACPPLVEEYDAESVYSQPSDPGSPVTDAGSAVSSENLPQTPTRAAAWPDNKKWAEGEKKRDSGSSAEGVGHWWQRRRSARISV